jgi:hypothetical protein
MSQVKSTSTSTVSTEYTVPLEHRSPWYRISDAYALLNKPSARALRDWVQSRIESGALKPGHHYREIPVCTRTLQHWKVQGQTPTEKRKVRIELHVVRCREVA